MPTTNSAALVQKLWSYCKVLRDDGLTYGDYYFGEALLRLRRVAPSTPELGVAAVSAKAVDGTNVASVPAVAGFSFAYGAASFTAHRAEASRLGLTLRLVPDRRLGWDVDVPADLAIPTDLRPPAYLTSPVPCP